MSDHLRRPALSGRWPARLLVVLLTVLLALPAAASPAKAARLVPISGAGSTWSQNALAQWATNVRQYGMVINYQGTGSSDGRRQFANNTVDFGVSEIPYGLTDGGVYDAPPGRHYAYMPIVAGGTSFMYNVKIGGRQVSTLRLSGDLLAKIFTGALTLWNDPQIKAENPGLALPARRIVPVVRSDGSGTTAQLTRWMAAKYPSTWDAYCVRAGRSAPCGTTSNYPIVSGVVVAQAGSVGVAGYVAQSTAEGAITYVEYSYALDARLPVVKLLNRAGYYVEPTPKNVAVGLLGVVINNNPSSPDYLTQNLNGVYDNPDRRAYPLSSYSYMIIPTALEGSLNADKGYTLARFSYYFLCQGQQQAPDLGYSPLPINLVQAGFAQIRKIPGVVAQDINIRSCNNPTFSTDGSNTLARMAPYPPACAKAGPVQCDANGNAPSSGGSRGGGNGSTGTGNGSGSGRGSGTGAGAGTSTGNGTGAGTGTGTGTGAGAGTGVGAGTGAGVGTGNGSGSGGAGASSGDTSGGSVNAAAVPVTLASDYTGGGVRTVLMALAALLLLALTLVPPLVARRATARSRR